VQTHIYNPQQQEEKENKRRQKEPRNATTRKNTRRSKNADANPRTSSLLTCYAALSFDSSCIQSFLLYSFRPQNKFSLVQPASKQVSVPQVNHPLSPTISQVLRKFTKIVIAIWNLIAYEIDFIFLLIAITSRLLLLSSLAPMQSNTEHSIALIPPSNYCPLLDKNLLQQLSSPRQGFIPKVLSVWDIIEAKLQSIIDMITLSCDQSLYKIFLKLQFFSSSYGKSDIWNCYRLFLSPAKARKPTVIQYYE
jgi:hypothetical protein